MPHHQSSWIARQAIRISIVLFWGSDLCLGLDLQMMTTVTSIPRSTRSLPSARNIRLPAKTEGLHIKM
ncbi:hypothetical protein CBS76997_7544 [Aspergillus niger]|nr:hypothetical protein CBS13152_7460 [Aspergillus niger]KAI2940633.1 hypothetical protein CBS147321_6109 [Aspergillus niger]KAI3039962.1 hypothetical protein CBS76997_7544 [Aspergillus niger]